jgi:hypothetical protein
VESTLETRMGRVINREKTQVVNLEQKDPLDFLAFTFRLDADLFGRGHRYLNVFPSKKAAAHERDVLRKMTSPNDVVQAHPRPCAAGQLAPQRLGELLPVRLSSQDLPGDQLVCVSPVRRSPEPTESAALSPSERGHTVPPPEESRDPKDPV